MDGEMGLTPEEPARLTPEELAKLRHPGAARRARARGPCIVTAGAAVMGASFRAIIDVRTVR